MFWNKWFEPKAFNQGYLPEKDGHKVYFAEYGNPRGFPVLVLHGGPGGCFKAKHVKVFDLKKYRVIGFDQRGCGKSHPLGQGQKNTVQDTLDDIDRLLEHLEIYEKIIIRGGSWGSTLALLFAERHPEKVKKLLLSQIFLADEASKKWEEEGTTWFYPDIWEQIKSKVRGGYSVGEYYARLINTGEAQKQIKAISYLGSYERILGSLDPKIENKAIDEYIVASNRIYINYLANSFYLKENQIMKNIKKISSVPTLIVHNRLDFVCPPEGAFRLHKALAQSRLVIVPDKGHVSKKLYQAIAKEIKKELEN